MSSTTSQPPLKTIATIAAADPNCTAVALREHSAAFVSFQRQQVKFPPAQNVDTAVSPVLAAMQFSGNIAQIATNVVTVASSATFRRSVWLFLCERRG